MGLCTSAFSLALNTYFKENRNKAFGIGATITGIGPIVLPHAVSVLLRVYGSQGCVLVIGGLTMNIIVASLLLRPYKPNASCEPSVSNNTQGKGIENWSIHKPTPSISFSGYERSSFHFRS
jgi:MFS family permease